MSRSRLRLMPAGTRDCIVDCREVCYNWMQELMGGLSRGVCYRGQGEVILRCFYEASHSFKLYW